MACGEADEPRPSDEPAESVTVVFTRDEAPAAVARPVPAGTADLASALEWLLRGPTEGEEARGIRSWFSSETAHLLRSAGVDPDGQAVVDFHADLRRVIPGASSSTGSTMLLVELDGTTFQLPEVESVEYRLDGSCDRFWEWLQYECRVVHRSEVEGAPGPAHPR